MKKIGVFLAGIMAASLVWMAFVREPLPPVPVVRKALSPDVKLDFSIQSMDYTGLELSLNNKVGGKGMFIHFQMANAWKTGRPGLVVKGINASSNFKGGMTPGKYLDDPQRKKQGGKDFSHFMKDKKGQAVSGYAFTQALVEGDDGKTYMRMTYDGPAMDMIQTLEIPQPVTIPAHISKQFVEKGVVQFQRGTVALDSKINGFYIPVVVR